MQENTDQNNSEYGHFSSSVKLHKIVRLNISDGVAKIGFYFLSNGNEPCFTQKIFVN